jgi:ligand-binding sensor domain-containing protein/two-component sensor histidine kinase
MRSSRPLRLALSLAFMCLLTALAPPARALDPRAQIHRYGFQSWQTDSGLPQNTVHALMQTRDGYLWLATEGGLVRFDGLQFTVFEKQNTPHLRSNLIYGLLEDSDGALWISTADGLTRHQGSAFQTFTTEDGLPSNTTWSVYLDRDGTLWALTADGLAQFRDGRFQSFAIPSGLSSSSSIAQAADGSLWIGTNSGLAHLSHDSLVPVPSDPSLDRSEIQALATDRDGRLWVGTRAGLKFLAAGKFSDFKTATSSPANDINTLLLDSAGRMWIGSGDGLAVYENGRVRTFSSRDGLPGSRIEAIFEDREHVLWISTDRGLARITPGDLAISTFTPRQGLSSNLVLSTLEDREGNLWIGTESGGLDVLRDRKFTTYTTQDGLTEDLVRSVFQDRKGTIWIGTNGGGLNRQTSEGFSVLATDNHLSSNIILALADDADGNLWLGTPDGLDRLRDGKVTVFTSADGLADDFVRSLLTAADGTLWIGTRRGLSHLKNGKFTTYTSMDGLGNDLVGALLPDNNGGLWVGTLGGLSHLVHERFTNYTVQNGLTSNVVTALYHDPADPTGTLWIGTSGGGMSRLRNGHIDRYPPSTSGLPENIYGILGDGSGYLWLSSNKGIFRVSRRDLDSFAAGAVKTLALSAYGTADGMKISECSSGGHPSVWKLHDGTLWFATLKGVATIDPEHTPVNLQPPLVAIEQISVDDQPLVTSDNPEPVQIRPGHSRFAIQYAGLSFVAPQKVRFQYKLEGFDKDWVDAGTRRTAYYTNLAPRRYVFRVKACNNDGVWSRQSTDLVLRLLPHFYQTPWFDLLVVLALGALGYGIYHWRLRRVESQFAVVLRERNRIAREIHDTLAQGFVAVSVQLEIVARQLATSGEAARLHLEQARVLVRSSLADARSSIWDLRGHSAEPQDRQDLAARLSSLADRLTATTPLKAHVQVNGAYRPLDRQVESELVRIGQEAVTNAVRHARAKHIGITLQFEEKRLRMTIHDDGRGFATRPASSSTDGHFGITGMHERAEQIGGQLTVNSRAGEGTEVCVEVEID